VPLAVVDIASYDVAAASSESEVVVAALPMNTPVGSFSLGDKALPTLVEGVDAEPSGDREIRAGAGDVHAVGNRDIIRAVEFESVAEDAGVEISGADPSAMVSGVASSGAVVEVIVEVPVTDESIGWSRDEGGKRDEKQDDSGTHGAKSLAELLQEGNEEVVTGCASLLLFLWNGCLLCAFQRLEVLSNRLELLIGIAFVKALVESPLFIDGILRHEGERRVTLWPEHPSAVVTWAQSVAGELEVGALALEGLQGGRFSSCVTGNAGVSSESRDIFSGRS
jgi:hypothetical protein